MSEQRGLTQQKHSNPSSEGRRRQRALPAPPQMAHQGIAAETPFGPNTTKLPLAGIGATEMARP
jgi:hypothetical protein